MAARAKVSKTGRKPGGERRAATEVRRLRAELAQALERQSAISDVLRVISSSHADIRPVLDVVAERAAKLCQATDAVIRRVDADGLRAIAHYGPEPLTVDVHPLAGSVVGKAVTERRTVHVHDIAAPGARAAFPGAPALLFASGHRTMLAVPLLRDGAATGAILIRRREVRPFSGQQIELLETFAQQAALAIENARLFHEARSLNEQRIARLKSFFSPQLAEALSGSGAESLLKTHRREITVQFFDLRGFTAFSGKAEPEEVMELLREFHGALGKCVLEHEGTIERFGGDSVMVFYNDPLPVERPAEHAMQAALTVMDAFEPIAARWNRRVGLAIGLGAGIAQGFATLGAIGFEGRWDYAAIGNVTNLAARLCGEAKAGQVLVDGKTASALQGCCALDDLGGLQLKGFAQPVPAFALRRRP